MELEPSYPETIEPLAAQRSVVARRSFQRLRRLAAGVWEALPRAIREGSGWSWEVTFKRSREFVPWPMIPESRPRIIQFK